MTIQHPARAIPFRELRQGLVEAINAGLVHEQRAGKGLCLYCYTKECVFTKAWTSITEISRGLIINHSEGNINEGRIVATPFPKFFNLGEREGLSLPSRMAFETYEKVDGSLIIIYWHDGAWCTATKGSFNSNQAVFAQRFIHQFDLSVLTPGYTYLAELVGPQNRIVIQYGKTELFLLGAYDNMGFELDYDTICFIGKYIGWPVARRYRYLSISELVEQAKTLPVNEEGFVVRYANGLRLKIKGEEYKRIHRLISDCTPLAMWKAMEADDDLQALRRDLPEEFWNDFDRIIALLQLRLGNLAAKATWHHRELKELSDKDVGLMLDRIPAEVRSFIFPLRKHGDLLKGKARHALFRAIRPTGNRLEGYEPSYGLNRVLDEAA